MESTVLYFDNAATSFPKPEAVYLACDQALRSLGNPGRGAHRLALNAARVMFEGRESLGNFLSLPPERLAFTAGCTAAINLVLNGLVGAARLGRGDTVICSSFEHNAVMRPLQWLSDHHGIKIVKIAPAPSHYGLIDEADFEAVLSREKPKLCVLSLASNVTGAALDLELADRLCGKYKVPLLIDGAQGTGALDLNLANYPALSFFAASAHKGLLGPAGLGFLYVAEGQSLDPLYCGGTGSRSESLEMPEYMPDRLEPGTAPVHLVAGLSAAIDHLEREGAAIVERERVLSTYFLQKLATMPQLKLHGRPPLIESGGTKFLPTFSLSMKALGADIIADHLDQKYNMAVRPGLHCAVSAHQILGTVSGGLLRVSLGFANSEIEIDSLFQALAEIAREQIS